MRYRPPTRHRLAAIRVGRRWPRNCYNGSMRACDRLADQTAAVDAPVYHDYGFSCGGRVNYDSTSAEDEYVGCVDQYPGS